METAEVVACVVRRPEDIWASWWHRREGLNIGRDGPGDDWSYVWDRFAYWTANRDMHYLPIDHASRDDRLAALAEKIGRAMDMDWSVVQNKGVRDRGQPPEIDFTKIYETPIIKELYQ